MEAANSQHPVSFRLLLALMAGIVCGNYLPDGLWIGVSVGAFALAVLSAVLCFRKGGRLLGGLSALLCLGCIGYVLAVHRLSAARYDFTGEPGIYRVSVREHPEEKPRSVQCQVAVTEEWQGETPRAYAVEKTFLLYVAKDSAAHTLRRGDELLVYTCLEAPVSSPIPDTFDYARYLSLRGICGTGYVAAGHWERVGHAEQSSLLQRALDMRGRVVGLFRSLHFEGDELAVLSALTVGDKNELSDEIRETYTVSGASHILALSGMHIALLYGLLYFLLSPLWKRRRKWRMPLLLLAIAFLWAFAFVTGLSASVVRAVAMCTLFILAGLRMEKPLAFDTLTATAFLMLLYNPLWLFDVGFQLSFLAVWGLLAIHPRLYALWNCKYAWLRKAWGLMSVSVSAQIATAPLVLFYFSRFPTHFLLTNLWVVPVSTLVLYAAVLLLALTPFPFLQQGFAPLVNGLVKLQNGGLQWIERLPYASVDGVWVGIVGVCLLYAFIFRAEMAWRERKWSGLQKALVFLLLFAGYQTVSSMLQRPRAGIVFYNVRGCPAVHCLSGGAYSWLVCADSVPEAGSLCRALSPHWNRWQLQPPQVVTGDYAHASLIVNNQMIVYGGRQICLLSDNRWRNMNAERPLHVDYLFAAKGYKGGVEELMPLFDIAQVIVDANLSPYYRQRIQADCNRLGIACRVLDKESMLQFDL